MSVFETIKNRRTIRRFKQDRLEIEVLKKIVDAGTMAPSGANLQPLKYVVAQSKEITDNMFPLVKWAAYISPEGTPKENEKPVAYIAVLVDTTIKSAGYQHDVGAAVENMLLVALDEGIGSCWMGAIDRDAIIKLLDIPKNYILDTVIALGYLDEQPISEDEQGSIKYYKDINGTLHVPKRRLEDVIIRVM